MFARELGEEGQADEQNRDAQLDDRVAAEQPLLHLRERWLARRREVRPGQACRAPTPQRAALGPEPRRPTASPLRYREVRRARASHPPHPHSPVCRFGQRRAAGGSRRRQALWQVSQPGRLTESPMKAVWRRSALQPARPLRPVQRRPHPRCPARGPQQRRATPGRVRPRSSQRGLPTAPTAAPTRAQASRATRRSCAPAAASGPPATPAPRRRQRRSRLRASRR